MSYRAPEALSERHALDEFDCGEPVLDEWLKRYAPVAQATKSARVFVTTPDDQDSVVGYYALAAAQVEPSDATERTRKGLSRHQAIPAVLLARLAVDLDHQGRRVGISLLKDAMGRCLAVAETIGVRVLLVHAKHEKAKAWYMKFDFEESPTDSLHLMMLMKDLQAAVRA
jgi:predicted N-acetyltransferase YhbS